MPIHGFHRRCDSRFIVVCGNKYFMIDESFSDVAGDLDQVACIECTNHVVAGHFMNRGSGGVALGEPDSLYGCANREITATNAATGEKPLITVGCYGLQATDFPPAKQWDQQGKTFDPQAV